MNSGVAYALSGECAVDGAALLLSAAAPASSGGAVSPIPYTSQGGKRVRRLARLRGRERATRRRRGLADFAGIDEERPRASGTPASDFCGFRARVETRKRGEMEREAVALRWRKCQANQWRETPGIKGRESRAVPKFEEEVLSAMTSSFSFYFFPFPFLLIHFLNIFCLECQKNMK